MPPPDNDQPRGMAVIGRVHSDSTLWLHHCGKSSLSDHSCNYRATVHCPVAPRDCSTQESDGRQRYLLVGGATKREAAAASMRPGRAPRIPPRCASGRSRGACFNEAGARAPRIRRAGWQSVHPSDSASMRPGRARPGYPPNARAARHRRARFNEAGAHAPRIPGRRAVRAHQDRAASMRPGRTRPGYHLRRQHQRDVHRASMRPGRTRPGYFAISDGRISLARLQ